MPPTIVIGLDGGNWPLIEQRISEGHLPNFGRLVSEGASGVSRSYLPPVTCPNWKCYAAGKNPGKLGVYWWELIDTDERSMTLPDSRNFTSPEIWDYLNDAGQRAGVINLPMSYSPRPIDGVMIAGRPRSRERRYTKPDELQSELEERFDYRVHPENVLTSNRNSQSEVEMIHDLLRVRMRAAKAMLEERDLSFLHLTLFHLNILQHYFWNSPETKQAWQIIDEELEPFVDGEYNVVLMSDHGRTEIDTVLFINEWLKQRGYLTTKRSLSSALYDIGITQDRLAMLARTLQFEEFVRPFVPRVVIERFPSDDGVVREEKLNMVDWESTAAVGSGQGLVYTIADNEAKRKRILSSLEADLADETSPNGRPIAEAVYRREGIYERQVRGPSSGPGIRAASRRSHQRSNGQRGSHGSADRLARRERSERDGTVSRRWHQTTGTRPDPYFRYRADDPVLDGPESSRGHGRVRAHRRLRGRYSGGIAVGPNPIAAARTPRGRIADGVGGTERRGNRSARRHRVSRMKRSDRLYGTGSRPFVDRSASSLLACSNRTGEAA
jgi:predicted AlkP superfamily phosphohydrolase/phosphomutase